MNQPATLADLAAMLSGKPVEQITLPTGEETLQLIRKWGIDPGRADRVSLIFKGGRPARWEVSYFTDEEIQASETTPDQPQPATE